jgi:hypothetical protein
MHSCINALIIVFMNLYPLIQTSIHVYEQPQRDIQNPTNLVLEQEEEEGEGGEAAMKMQREFLRTYAGRLVVRFFARMCEACSW